MSDGYQGLRFSFADTEREIEGMVSLARTFLERGCPERIAAWKKQLTNFRLSPRKEPKLKWQIPENDALRTKLSDGEYERSSHPEGDGEYRRNQRRGREKVLAVVSGIWEIERLPERDKDQGSHFLLKGNASTKVELIRPDNTPLGSWHFDVGDGVSPGCHFHVQCTNEGNLPVPRYPALLFTPMDAIEFTLAELFQDRWEKHALGRARAAHWADFQRQRMTALLRWQLDFIQRCSGSPWTALKVAKPAASLFV